MIIYLIIISDRKMNEKLWGQLINLVSAQNCTHEIISSFKFLKCSFPFLFLFSYFFSYFMRLSFLWISRSGCFRILNVCLFVANVLLLFGKLILIEMLKWYTPDKLLDYMKLYFFQFFFSMWFEYYFKDM